MTSRRPVRAASAAGARGRSHQSLAPAHLGEAAAAATVGVVVGGIALVITGIGMIAMALTIGGRYGADAPPGVASIGIGPLVLGLLVLLLGVGLAAGGTAVFAAIPRARTLTGILSGLAFILSVAGVLLAMARPPADPVLATALTVAALIFGASAILLLRPRR